MESKERDILMVMRRVLTSVIRDVTPAPGRPSPLTEGTSDGVRECLKLIALRERELADAAGDMAEKPYYVDQHSGPKVVPIADIAKPSSSKTDDG
jgi:hypothetical protein